jgi:hypothetical protein
MKRINITENDIMEMVSKAVRNILNENFNNTNSTSDNTNIMKLMDFLKREGVENIHLSKFPSGYPCLNIDSEEYQAKNVGSMVVNFENLTRLRVSEDIYPAIVRLSL